MNEGARLDEIIHEVSIDKSILEKSYLRPIYDEPEFVVRNIWRMYGGWYDGNPAHLKPSPEHRLTAELANMAGGAMTCGERAQALVTDRDFKAHFSARLSISSTGLSAVISLESAPMRS